VRPGAMVGFAGAKSDAHVAKFEQKPNPVFGPEELTLAYGTWGLPGLVEDLRKPKSVEFENKALVALEELCRVSEKCAQACQAGVVDAVLAKMTGADEQTRVPPSDLILRLLGTLAKDTLGRQAILRSKTLSVFKSTAPGGDGFDELCLHLCMLREGADALYEAGYLDLLPSCLQSPAAGFSASDATRWLRVLARMLVESSGCLHYASEHTQGQPMCLFLKGCPRTDEDLLCAGVDVLLAITMEDCAKQALIEAGGVDAACLLLSGGKQNPTELAPLGWLAQSKLLSLVAQLCVVVPGKQALVKGNWLKMLSRGLRGCDSILLQRAVVQCLLHAADHPQARELLLGQGAIQDLEALAEATADEFVKRVCGRTVEALQWTP